MKKLFIFVAVLAAVLILSFTLVNLRGFPPYFFCDEAIHAIEARNILRSGLDSRGRSWPIFFEGLGQYQLSLSVYLQIPFTAVFGVDEFAVRVRNLCLSVFALLWSIGISNRLFTSRANWSIFFISISSSFWFLHIRTGFESPVAVIFLLGAIYYYLKYLDDYSKQSILISIFFLSLSFYSYLPARMWVGIVFLIGFFSNLKIHWKYKNTSILASIFLFIFLSPYLYFQIYNPKAPFFSLEPILRITITGKYYLTLFYKFLVHYSNGIDARFWFFWEHTSNDGPQLRHVIPEMPLIPTGFVVFWITGLITLIWRFSKDNKSRFIVLTLILLPLSCAPFGVTNLRLLPIGCLYLIIIMIGISVIYERVKDRLLLKSTLLVSVVFIILRSLVGLSEAVQYPERLKYKDYGFYGLQSGARDVFQEINNFLISNPDAIAILDYASFNGNQEMATFYIDTSRRQRVVVSDFNLECKGSRFVPERSLWIGPADRYKKLVDLSCKVKFTDPHPINATVKMAPFYKAMIIHNNPVIAVE